MKKTVFSLSALIIMIFGFVGYVFLANSTILVEVLNNIVENSVLSTLIGFAIGFILIVFVNPISKALMYLHECGHVLHLVLAVKVLGFENLAYNVVSHQKRKLTMCTGHTESNLYTYMQENKLYNQIRLNALAGSLLVVVVSIVLFALSAIVGLSMISGFFISATMLEGITFLGGSDFKHFLQPEKFEYSYC